MIKISAPSRIHVSLLSLHENSERKYGGFGFAIDKRVVVRATKSNYLDIVDQTQKLKESDVNKLKVMLGKAKLALPVKVYIDELPPTHSGFGSGTSLALSVLEASFVETEKTYDEDLLIRLSNRGRTSGIGIETYFRGGAVLDVGVSGKNHGFKPSSASKDSDEVARAIFRCDLPNWKIGLILNCGYKGLSGEAENDFFERSLPLKKEYSYEAVYKAVMGLVPACIESDLPRFRQLIEEFQGFDWKNKEIAALGAGFVDFFNSVKRNIPYVGMSSMGPLLYYIYDHRRWDVGFICDRYDCLSENVFPDNHGRIVTHA